jgi:hypothetical protein
MIGRMRWVRGKRLPVSRLEQLDISRLVNNGPNVECCTNGLSFHHAKRYRHCVSTTAISLVPPPTHEDRRVTIGDLTATLPQAETYHTRPRWCVQILTKPTSSWMLQSLKEVRPSNPEFSYVGTLGHSVDWRCPEKVEPQMAAGNE